VTSQNTASELFSHYRKQVAVTLNFVWTWPWSIQEFSPPQVYLTVNSNM